MRPARTPVPIKRTDVGIAYSLFGRFEFTCRPLETFYKIAAGNSKMYELEISVLPEHKSDYLLRIKEMIESFAVK